MKINGKNLELIGFIRNPGGYWEWKHKQYNEKYRKYEVGISIYLKEDSFNHNHANLDVFIDDKLQDYEEYDARPILLKNVKKIKPVLHLMNAIKEYNEI